MRIRKVATQRGAIESVAYFQLAGRHLKLIDCRTEGISSRSACAYRFMLKIENSPIHVTWR